MVEGFHQEQSLIASRRREDGGFVRVVSDYIFHRDEATDTNRVLAVYQLDFEVFRFGCSF